MRGRAWPGLLVALVLSALSACTSTGGLPPAVLRDLPGVSGRDSDVLLQRALLLGDEGRTDEALALLRDVLRDDPRHVDAVRARQDLLREQGRIGLVLQEARDRVAAWEGAATSLYLEGRVTRSKAKSRALFEAAVAADPACFWGWHGLAHSLRQSDPARAGELYERLYRASSAHPLVAISYASHLRANGDPERAAEIYGQLRGREDLPGVGDLGLAETLLRGERGQEGFGALLRSLMARPFDPGVRLLVDILLDVGVRDAAVEQMMHALWGDAAGASAFAANGGAMIAARLYERAGDLPSAVQILRSHAADASAAQVRAERRLTLVTGDVHGFLARLRASAREDLLADETNQVRGLWRTLLDGPWHAVVDPLAEPGHVVGLVDALVRVGLLDEAQLVASSGLLRHERGRTAARLQMLRDEARRELAFEAGLRDRLYRGYTGQAGSLTSLLDDLRTLSRSLFGKDVIGSPRTFAVPLVGRLVDPFGEGLAAHFRRYNRHLVLGQRAGGPPEGLLFTRVSVRYLEPDGPLPLAGQAREVLGEGRQVRSLSGVLGGDLAGVALLNHYVIDLDAVTDWARSLRTRRRSASAQGGALLRDPVPTFVEPEEPVDVAWRLGAVSPVEDTGLDAAVLDMIRWHERAHLVDSFRFLPPERNLVRVLGLLVGQGFRPGSVEAEMEGRAELAALAFSPHTELVLAHVAGFLEDDLPGSAHADGFGRLARRLNDALAAQPDFAPMARVSRWHDVPMSEFRRIARSEAGRLWP
jgi:tetratricopeptide (TPR) repeat protein